MNTFRIRRWAGILFIAGAILVNLPYTFLIMNFNYPDILREDTAQILTKFHEGGSGLIWQWFAFAWIGLPLLGGVILLDKILAQTNPALARIATVAGVIALVAQIVGLLRWTFVVPVLANLYTAPGATPATKEAVGAVFQVVHQYGGVVLGEHVGQFFVIVWMALVSLIMFKSPLFQAWVGWFGLFTSIVYLLAQSELFATVIPGFLVVPQAGLYGSLLWLVWMIVMGIFLVWSKNYKFSTNEMVINNE